MRKSRVFIGPLEIAGAAQSMAEALRSQGIKADFVTYSNSKHPFGYRGEKIMLQYEKPFIKGLNRLLRGFYFIKNIILYNTFIFLSPASLLPKNLDLTILKKLRKKIIFIFTGCAERDPLFDVKDPDYICNRCIDEKWQKMFLCRDVIKKRNRIEKFERYSDVILSQSDSAAFLKHKAPVWLYIVSSAPRQVNYLAKYSRSVTKIIHLPSNPLVKQSHIISPILKEINKLENTEVVIKDGIWERERILYELENSHILVDALGLGYGMLGVEGMARGCVVLNSHPKWHEEHVPDAPIFRTTAKTLYDDICYLLKNRNIMIDYANRSIEFYNKYHSPEAAGRYYKDKLELS